MTDLPSPFEPLPTPPAADKPKRKRTASTKKSKAAGNGTLTIDQQQSTDRPRKAKAARRGRPSGPKAPAALKIEFGTAMALASEMKPADTELFGQIVVALQKVGKGARTRIAVALGKMFG